MNIYKDEYYTINLLLDHPTFIQEINRLRVNFCINVNDGWDSYERKTMWEENQNNSYKAELEKELKKVLATYNIALNVKESVFEWMFLHIFGEEETSIWRQVDPESKQDKYFLGTPFDPVAILPEKENDDPGTYYFKISPTATKRDILSAYEELCKKRQVAKNKEKYNEMCRRIWKLKREGIHHKDIIAKIFLEFDRTIKSHKKLKDLEYKYRDKLRELKYFE